MKLFGWSPRNKEMALDPAQATLADISGILHDLSQFVLGSQLAFILYGAFAPVTEHSNSNISVR